MFRITSTSFFLLFHKPASLLATKWLSIGAPCSSMFLFRCFFLCFSWFYLICYIVFRIRLTLRMFWLLVLCEDEDEEEQEANRKKKCYSFCNLLAFIRSSMCAVAVCMYTCECEVNVICSNSNSKWIFNFKMYKKYCRCASNKMQ